MWCHDGKISLAGFISGIVTTVFTSQIVLTFFALDLSTWQNVMLCFIGPIGTYGLFCVITYFVTSENDFAVCLTAICVVLFGATDLLELFCFCFQIIKRATALGVCSGLSAITICHASNAWKPFGVYFCFMAFFHYSEYLTISFANPQTLSTDTFMLNHSIPYIVAATTSWLEFIIEVYFWPSLKGSLSVLFVGIAMCVFGEIVRKLAIITASTSFNHIVQYHKSEDHVLVTHGIYRLMRHPSYAGWFWWSIGTQIILTNPICIILYAIVSWKFFYERILIEEVTLVNFFQEQYIEYQKTTPTGVPFVKGYIEGAYDESSFQ